MGIVNNALMGASGQAGYNISNSLRFQSASSQFLNRTTGSVTNNKILTLSAWVKRGTLGVAHNIFSAGLIINGVSADVDYLQFTSSNTLQYTHFNGSVYDVSLITTQVFQDPSAWYHILIAIDTTQATASNRVKLYVNGSQVTAFTTATYPALNGIITSNKASTVTRFGSSVPDAFAGAAWGYFDGYLAEVNFVDGQALTPSSFGETNTLTGQWIAKKYNGTYGTNGFYLPFSNGTSTTTLGADSSGNGNNWTLTNFTRSAGVSDCWMIDVPSGNSGASATQPSSNYCVLNPLDMPTVAGMTITNSNLNSASSSTDNRFHCRSTTGMTSGKFYWEVTAISGNRCQAGIALATSNKNEYVGYDASGWGIFQLDGAKFYNQAGTSGTPYGSAWSTAGDILMTAFDADSGKLWWGKNGTWFASGDPVAGTNAAYSGLASNTYFPAIGDGSGAGVYSAAINFGQRSFAYTPPSGFKALCTANLPASTIVKGNEYMDAVLWTSTATVKDVTGIAFQPDIVWVKSRASSSANEGFHHIVDSVRGVGRVLSSNSVDAEYWTGTDNSVQAFLPNGFTAGDADGLNGNAMVTWQWDAGSSTVTNNDGTISSQVRANPTAGVSVVTYTGTFVNATVGHGLGIAPSMIIVKRRDSTGAWPTYHSSLSSPATGTLYLNTTNARVATTGLWNSTSPTSSVFNIGQNTDSNASGGTYVAYCFAEIAGFSKFGSYTGNGSTDGPFVYTGFRPKFVMIKASSTAENWNIIDSVRGPYNLDNLALFPSLANAETANIGLDLLSNGFKLRTTNAVNGNASGATYIYMAFAENPLAQSNAR